ncbi:MAG: Acg family FMN-binding oxidoreductase [Jiangellaceae bacterium]
MFATLTHTDVEKAVRAATLAPSVLNIQPWRFVARGDAIEMHRDPDRALPVTDTGNRALTVSCGAALFNLRLAVAHLIGHPEVDMLPDPTRPTLLAVVRAGDGSEPTPAESRLYAAIGDRRSSRVPFVDQPLPVETIVRLENAAAAEGATLRFLNAYEAADVSRLVHQADLVQRADADIRAEVGRWTGRRPGAVDGIPDVSLGPKAKDPSSLVRDFALGLPVEGRDRAAFEHDPALAVLLSDHDGPADWLQAGQALERLWLEATVNGVGVSLLTQPLEMPGMRWLARPAAAGTFWPQALIRLGVPIGKTPPTPRRPLADVLTFDRRSTGARR